MVQNPLHGVESEAMALGTPVVHAERIHYMELKGTSTASTYPAPGLSKESITWS